MTVEQEEFVTYIRTKRGWMWVNHRGDSAMWFPTRDAANANYIDYLCSGKLD